MKTAKMSPRILAVLNPMMKTRIYEMYWLMNMLKCALKKDKILEVNILKKMKKVTKVPATRLSAML